MCSYPNGDHTTFEDSYRESIKTLQNEKPNNQLAGALFLADDLIYKSWDYRCLAPSRSKPRKWRTYNMASFRAASNKVMLNSVKTIKYDKNFNNC